MTQDFAKIRPEPLLERKTVATPPAWSLMFTGVFVGMALGVFGCFLFYLSGNVPPLAINQPVNNNTPSANQPPTVVTAEEPAEEELQLDFYTELPAYEVSVDVNPVELTAQQAGVVAEVAAVLETRAETEETFDPGFILQSGAFQQFDSARNENDKQRLIGLDVHVKQQELLGRTLYLVQSGPYTSSNILKEAEQLLRANNIPSLRMTIQ
ncbi:MAG: SPOR domain-containing protein [Pseudomonadales bacterium]|jgi:cell division protein FtsN|tara:strand:+ start:1073 stop:1702 length:630 start_codon:yes stop_codon:yes gene_type:complete